MAKSEGNVQKQWCWWKGEFFFFLKLTLFDHWNFIINKLLNTDKYFTQKWRVEVWRKDTPSLGGWSAPWNPPILGFAKGHGDTSPLHRVPSSLGTGSTPSVLPTGSGAENCCDTGFGKPLGLIAVIPHFLPINKESSLRQWTSWGHFLPSRLSSEQLPEAPRPGWEDPAFLSSSGTFCS